MASATGLPASHIERADHSGEADTAYAESAPLLGGTGDASQKEGKSIAYNLILGTAPIAQAGIILLTLHIWTTILLAKPMPTALFTTHPLLNSAAIFILIESLLLLQPTHTASQKRRGARLHGALNTLAVLLAIGGLSAILANKIAHHGVHFASPHAVLGLITYILLVAQALVGSTMYWFPALYGGDARARAVWKYHRASGYLGALVALATVLAACWTDYNVAVLDVKVWAVVVCELLIVVGVGARIRLAKFGINRGV